MGSKSQRLKGRDGILSSLNEAIDGLNLAKELSNISQVTAVFGSVSTLLTTIRDTMADEQGYVELGLFCANICKALDRGMNGGGPSDLSRSVCDAIDELTTTIAEIQERAIQGMRKVPRLPQFIHVMEDKLRIADWTSALNGILVVFDTEFTMNTHIPITNTRRSVLQALTSTSRLVRGGHNETPPSFLVLLFTVLDYPPFNEVIRWEGTKHVVLEQPRILGSYILMPVFGLPTLDVFKRKLYTFGFDCVPHLSSSHNTDPETAAWEHPRFTRLNPPTGFTSRDWSEVIESDNPATMGLFKPDEVALEEVFHPRGPIPIPVSADGGKTLDWSRSAKSEIVTYGSIYSDPIFTHGSIYSGPMVHHEKKLVTIRLRSKPKARELASKVTEDLQRRYDLLFFHLETPKPLRLNSIVRWGISNSKIPAHAWKSPIPTQVIEDYLTEEPDDPPTLPIPEKDWVHVVTDFISKCDHLYKTTEPESGPFPLGDSPRARSGTSSRASSLSEGHVSPEDDGPSKKVVHWDD